MKPLAQAFPGQRFGTILADPPWRFESRTGKTSPEHKRLFRCPGWTSWGEELAA